MFCEYCGAKMSEGARFCPVCGKRKAAAEEMMQKQNLPELKTKIFNFDSFSHNKENIEVINEWLWKQSIRINALSMNAFMNHIFFNWETVINHLEIEYYEAPNAGKYQFWYFSSSEWLVHSFEHVTQQFEEWKSQHGDQPVVWHTYAGHKRDSRSTQAVFFLYRAM